MRVVIPMLFYYPDRPSGSTRLGFDQAVFMARQGHEVWVVTQDPDGTKPEYEQRDGLHVLHYRSPSLHLFDPRRTTIHQNLTANLLRKYAPPSIDLLHGHALLQYDGALRVYQDTRKVYSIHSPVKLEMQASSRGANKIKSIYFRLNGLLNNGIEGRVLKMSDVITSDSEFTREAMKTLHGMETGQRVQVVPGWVDLEKFRPMEDRDAIKKQLGWPVDVPLLFTLRRLVPRNGIDTLLLALKQVKEAGSPFKMVIGGSGPLQPQLEAQAAQMNLNDVVTFTGFVADRDVPLMYAACDVFILPTAELECFGLPTIEAFAAGRPVLATPVGAIPEVLKPVEPAWLARDHSAQAIAELILRYLKGELPIHTPETLRHVAETGYSETDLVRQLIATALGT